MKLKLIQPLFFLVAIAAAGCGKKPAGGEAQAGEPAGDPKEGSPEVAAAPAAKGAPAAGSCIMLGWGGGAAGSGYKMVKSDLEVLDDGARLVIKYQWKGGVMTMHRTPGNPSLYSGTWQQQGSSGTGSLNFSEPFTKATGSWSQSGTGPKAMTVTPCG